MMKVLQVEHRSWQNWGSQWAVLWRLNSLLECCVVIDIGTGEKNWRCQSLCDTLSLGRKCRSSEGDEVFPSTQILQRRGRMLGHGMQRSIFWIFLVKPKFEKFFWKKRTSIRRRNRLHFWRLVQCNWLFSRWANRREPASSHDKDEVFRRTEACHYWQRNKTVANLCHCRWLDGGCLRGIPQTQKNLFEWVNVFDRILLKKCFESE